jgi:hypothetical protein
VATMTTTGVRTGNRSHHGALTGPPRGTLVVDLMREIRLASRPLRVRTTEMGAGPGANRRTSGVMSHQCLERHGDRPYSTSSTTLPQSGRWPISARAPRETRRVRELTRRRVIRSIFFPVIHPDERYFAHFLFSPQVGGSLVAR